MWGRVFPIELEFGSVSFYGGRKTGEPGEKPSDENENQQQTQPTYDTGPESNPGHIGGRRALSPLGHPCSPKPLRRSETVQDKTTSEGDM